MVLGYPGRYPATQYWHCRRGRRVIPCAVYHPNEPNGCWVVFSTGFGGSAYDYSRLASGWANRGFGTVVVEHPGSSRGAALKILPQRYLRPGPGLRSLVYNPECLRHRPLDLIRVIDRVEVEFRPRRLVVAGHSYGAYSAVALAGPTVNGQGSFADPRVDALIAISFQPPGQLFPAEQYSRIEIPSLWVLAADDWTADGTTTDERLELRRWWPQVNLVVIPGADHMDLADMGPGHEATGKLLHVTTQFLHSLIE